MASEGLSSLRDSEIAAPRGTDCLLQAQLCRRGRAGTSHRTLRQEMSVQELCSVHSAV